MDTKEIFAYLVEQIHTVIVATTDAGGLPVTCAIDMMDDDERGLYFLTAKGKGFYDRLKRNGVLALTGLKGEDTLSRVAVSLQGRIRELGPARLPALFEKNPYMARLYPEPSSRAALTVFQIYEGAGEWFDLSKQPIQRASFSFGAAASQDWRYRITARCTGCKRCLLSCPQRCIDLSVTPAVIEQAHCLHCGNCLAACPVGAVEKKETTAFF